MINRFVKLEIDPLFHEEFIAFTKGEREDIISFQGCSFLRVYQDQEKSNVFYTHSKWESVDALNNYRESDFFRGNWAKVKKWFIAKPEAWSLNDVHNEE